VLELSEEKEQTSGDKKEENVFSKLNPQLQKIVKKRFEQPTLPQQLAIPPILAGMNMLVISETGSGKTESVIFPVLSMILDKNPKPVCALYITPLKALNRDLLDRLVWWANELGLEISVRHGDTSQYERKMQMEFPPHILIVTLETLQPILTAKKFRENLRNIKYVILDEVHEAIESKRGIQLALGLERLKKLCSDFQLIMLSATVGSPEKVAAFFSAGKNVKIVRAETAKQFEIKVISPKPEAKDEAIAKKVFTSKETAARLRTIMELIKHSRSSLTFTNTREFAEILASRIKTIDKKFPAEIHHSSLSKEVRIKTEKRFKAEEIKSIVSTSSLQLGIDIGSIDLVLQYMSPRRVSQLVQRVGRSGHGLERVSRGIVVATDEDDCFESAVIARRALAGELEPTRSHKNSLDVLAHQIVGMTLEDWKLDVQETYQTVRRAEPYSTLSFDEFMSVCRQLQQIGLVFLNNEIKKKRRGLEYYFSRLSTIPDVKQYRIFNTLDQSFVGVLDEEFMALHGEPGTTFIVKGEPWRIIETEEDRVLVEPSNDIEAAIPGWEGELMPVSYEVAQEVGQLRTKILEWLDKKLDEKIDAEEELKRLYPVDDDVAKKIVKIIKQQKKHDPTLMPEDKTILVEDYENIVVLHACFGSVANDTLGRFLAALLTSRVGSIGLKTDPYRIMVQFQNKNVELIKDILLKTKPEYLQSYLEMALTKSEMFEWKFVHVAKRFGAFSRDVQFGRTRLKNIINDYANTPLFKEALRELETEKLDIERATEILRKIQSGEIKLVFKKGISPLGKLGIKHKWAEVIGPERPTREIFELFKQRLMNTKRRLVCMNCGEWSQTYTINEMPEQVKCPKCDAKLLAVMHPLRTDTQRVVQKALKDKPLNELEQKVYERARDTAALYIEYNIKAVIALAGRGVGPHTAKKILRKYHETQDDLLKDILEAEKQFLRTKKYWKI